jgi:hypothetical protein
MKRLRPGRPRRKNSPKSLQDASSGKIATRRHLCKAREHLIEAVRSHRSAAELDPMTRSCLEATTVVARAQRELNSDGAPG